MSSMTPHDLECPHCGNRQETIVWHSINVKLDPELKGKLFQAQINLFSCAKCGKKTPINTPLLYHDMNQHFCVQFYPPEELKDANFFAQFNPDGSIPITGIPAPLAKSAEYLSRPHIVFDMDEMVRYVAFRERITETRQGIVKDISHERPQTES